MESFKVPVRTRARDLGIVALIFGLVGGAFYWWTPLGMVLSIAGLLLGFVSWTMSDRTVGVGLPIAGMLVSLAALILDSVIAGFGLEIVRLHAFR